MPYIKPECRGKWQRPLAEINGLSKGIFAPDKAGELNYVISKILIGFYNENPSYREYAEMVSALECAKMELYRRSVAPYEDVKIKENGDLCSTWFLPNELGPGYSPQQVPK